VHERVSRGEPVRHLVGEPLDANALPGERPCDPRAHAVVSTAETDHERNVRQRQRDLHGLVEPADSPAAARDENDLAARRQPERPACVFARTRLEERAICQAGDAVDARRVAGDPPYLRYRLGVREQMHVRARGRPVPERCKVGDRGAHGNVEPPAAAESSKHLGRVRIRRHDDVGPVRVDHTQEPARADAIERGLRDAARRTAPSERPEAEVPEPVEPVEDNPRCALADGDDGAPHRREPVLDDDLDRRLLLAELLGQRSRWKVVALADARGQDQDARDHPPIVRGSYSPVVGGGWQLLEIFVLGLGSMFWPLLLVVVVLALHTDHALKILVWFWLGGMLTTVSVGCSLVFALQDSSLMTGSKLHSAPWVDIVVGALALLAAAVLRRVGKRNARREPETEGPKKQSRSSAWVEHLVESGGPLAFVGGIVASILPAPLALIAMADIAQLGYSTSATVLVIVGFYLVMFTFVELPIGGFVVAPDWTRAKADQFNAWLSRNLVSLGVWALTILGTFEIARGIATALR
jgi:Sap, sulfolipid-1-addressing protein